MPHAPLVARPEFALRLAMKLAMKLELELVQQIAAARTAHQSHVVEWGGGEARGMLGAASTKAHPTLQQALLQRDALVLALALGLGLGQARPHVPTPRLGRQTPRLRPPYRAAPQRAVARKSGFVWGGMAVGLGAATRRVRTCRGGGCGRLPMPHPPPASQSVLLSPGRLHPVLEGRRRVGREGRRRGLMGPALCCVSGMP